MKVIRFEITQEGKVTITPTGFSGSSCKDATKAFEEALGIVTHDEETSDMWKTQTTDSLRLEES